jgi:hypothetical protein
MRIPCLAAVTAFLLSSFAVPAVAADVDFSGMVDLRNCSGSVVRTPSAQPTDPALVMSNGHCLKFLAPGEVVVDQPSSRTFTLLDAAGKTLAPLPVAKVAYATMTDTDVSFYRLHATYAELEALGGKALELSAAHPKARTDIRVVSGLWKRVYSCRVDGFVHRLREADWTWTDSIRYTAPCHTIAGTSGSPIVDVSTGKVIGVNNTVNENGESCTQNNPCEVNSAGEVTVREGIAYGQQTYQAVACIGAASVITLTAPGCTLPRP